MHTAICLEVENIDDERIDLPRFIWAYIVLSYVDVTLKFASNFFHALRYSWPITVKAELETNEPMRISRLSSNTPFNPRKSDHLSDFSHDLNLSLLDVETTPSQLAEDRTLLLSSAYNLFWAFGLGWSESVVAKWLAEITS